MERFRERLPRSEQKKLCIAGATVAEPCGPIRPWRRYEFVTVHGTVVAKGTRAWYSLSRYTLEFLVPVSNVDT